MNINFLINIIKARFKSAATLSFWAAFVLLMLGVLALGFIFNRPDGLQIRVGVLTPQTERAETLLAHFEYYAERNCDVAVYESEEQMKRDVSANKLECAYVLDGEKITAYRSPWTAADKVLDMMVAAVYAEGLAGELGADVLSGFSEEDPAVLAGKIQARANEYLKDGALMEMEYIEAGGEPANEESETEPRAPYYRLFHGLTGLAGLLLAMLCALSAGGEADEAAAERLGASAMFGAAGLVMVFTLTFVFMCAAFLAGNLLFPGVVVSWPGEMLTAFAFALAVAGVSVLLASVLPASVMPSVVTFVFVFAAVFGGAVFDIREVFEPAAPLRFLFPNYFFVSGNYIVLIITGLITGAGALVKLKLVKK